MAVRKRSWSRPRQHLKIRQKLKRVVSAPISQCLRADAENVQLVSGEDAAVAVEIVAAIDREPQEVVAVAAEMATSKTVQLLKEARKVRVVVAVATRVAMASAVDVAVELVLAMIALLNRLRMAIIRDLPITTVALKILTASKVRPARITTPWTVSLAPAEARKT